MKNIIEIVISKVVNAFEWFFDTDSSTIVMLIKSTILALILCSYPIYLTYQEANEKTNCKQVCESKEMLCGKFETKPHNQLKVQCYKPDEIVVVNKQ